MAEMHYNLEISTCDPLKCKMGNSILILSTRQNVKGVKIGHIFYVTGEGK